MSSSNQSPSLPTQQPQPQLRPEPRTEADHLETLAGRLIDWNVRTRIRRAFGARTCLSVSSNGHARLNELITCNVDGNGEAAYFFSWGDRVPGDTVDAVAATIARVVTIEDHGDSGGRS